MSIIKTENLTKTYKIGKVETHAIENINLEIEEGEFISIIGKNGSRKIYYG